MYTETEASQKNQVEFKEILKNNKLTQKKAAELLVEITERSCSERSIRAWLASPDIRSARPCPNWPVNILAKKFSAA